MKPIEIVDRSAGSLGPHLGSAHMGHEIFV